MSMTQLRDLLREHAVPSRQSITDTYHQIDLLAEFLAAKANDAAAACRPAYNPQRQYRYYQQVLHRLAHIGGASLITVVFIATYSLGPQLGRIFVGVVYGLLGYIPGAATAGLVASYMPTVMAIVFMLMCLRHVFYPAAIEE